MRTTQFQMLLSGEDGVMTAVPENLRFGTFDGKEGDMERIVPGAAASQDMLSEYVINSCTSPSETAEAGVELSSHEATTSKSVQRPCPGS